MLDEGDECWARKTSVGERDECWMRETSVG